MKWTIFADYVADQALEQMREGFTDVRHTNIIVAGGMI